MAEKHTPTRGPWYTEGFDQKRGRGHFYGGLIIGADGETIVAQCVAEHDAILIAAAPAMLAALEAEEAYTAYLRAASDATPDGEAIPAEVSARARYLGNKAERLRRAAIAQAKGASHE